NVIESIKNNPDSRRHIVSAWDVQNIKDMALPPCHTMFQFYVNNDELSCHLYQRSGDLALGVPFNISSYSLLVHMIARICNLYPGEFIHTLGDVHIYHNNFGGLQQQLLRKPKALPTLEMPSFSSLEELINTKVSEFILKDYVYDDHIYFDMAV
ncbi:MAG: thymidylate synthase, partial [Candidatus Woesearchaeota archaeon]